MDLLRSLVEIWSSEDALHPLVRLAVTILALALACLVANLLAKNVISRIVHRVVRKTRITWDDKLMERKVFTRLSHLLPGLILYYGALGLEDPAAVDWLRRMALTYIWFAVAWSLHALLNAAHDIYRDFDFSASRPITGYVQTLHLILWASTAIFAVAALLNKSPAGFLTGLGALSAVLMLVFKDSITGLVAGIQITANDMVRIGDWIEMPRYNADGDVIDITLHTVKVRNWDKTYSTIPTQALIQDSFKNWRGMQEAGGRRIKRALMIDVQSVAFCDEELLARLETIAVLRPYLHERKRQVRDWNEEHGVDGSCPLNGRRLTNLGTFRAYVEAYLRNHPFVHQQGLTFLVRQLAATDKGVPVEIYVFVNDIRWVRYEAVQADIFDHLFAAVHFFDLRLYQAPAGGDVRALAERERLCDETRSANDFVPKEAGADQAR